MRILVAGANGQLGREIVEHLQQPAIDVVPLAHRQLDITDEIQIRNCISTIRPTLVVNSAAYTNVDDAETEQHIAYAVNQKGAGLIADACMKGGIPLIHISTDFVFDGRKGTPYTESDSVCPLGVYGKSKADGEREITTRLREYIIIRTSWLYGVYGHNFVKTMIRLGKEGSELSVVSDQFGSPTCAADLAEAIATIVRKIGIDGNPAWGIYHYSGKGVTSWFDFAVTIFRMARQRHKTGAPAIRPISASQYPTKAKRPKYSALDCSKITNAFGIKTKPWKESLAAVVHQILIKKTYTA